MSDLNKINSERGKDQLFSLCFLNEALVERSEARVKLAETEKGYTVLAI